MKCFSPLISVTCVLITQHEHYRKRRKKNTNTCQKQTFIPLSYKFNTTLTTCSIPLYSPSVFSRIVTRSTSVYGVLYPSIDLQGRTLAYRLKALQQRKVRQMYQMLTISGFAWPQFQFKNKRQTYMLKHILK